MYVDLDYLGICSCTVHRTAWFRFPYNMVAQHSPDATTSILNLVMQDNFDNILMRRDPVVRVFLC